MSSAHRFNESVGLLKTGTIVGYDPDANTIKVRLANTQAVKGNSSLPIEIPVPHSLFYNNGLYVGSLPTVGTPIVVGQGSGNQYYFVSFNPGDPTSIPLLTAGQLLLQSTENSKITLDDKANISIGSHTSNIHINSGDNQSKTNYITLNFNNKNTFTQAHRSIIGQVKRDTGFISDIDQNSKLFNDDYDIKYNIVGLDPSTTANDHLVGTDKNPPFVEHREMLYEFQLQSNISDDITEANLYNKNNSSNNVNTSNSSTTYTLPNRRTSRADTLSLTLLEPNYLMETVKGTVVDIFGNILDLNRTPLPLGQDQNTLQTTKSSVDKQTAFNSIKALERKSLAYHFEINARKDLSQSGNTSGNVADLLDINSNDDNSRLRSRFFMDIDKEGQFKLNIPASSETGNIPLLTRYENYSSFGGADNGNPNALVFRADKLDIFQDSFAAPQTSPNFEGLSLSTGRGVISLSDGDADGAPIDRITSQHIKHGTAHHDITQACWLAQSNDTINYQTGAVESVPPNPTPLANVVHTTINISGDSANAGGRSGSINMDGSLDLNIGANTIDRQSLIVDFAGGIVSMIGKDLKNNSGIINMDGNLFLQVGSYGISTDSRFEAQDNGIIGNILDLRVLGAGGYSHLIRIDDQGIYISTPGSMTLYAKGSMTIASDTSINIDTEQLTMQSREVLKIFGGTI